MNGNAGLDVTRNVAADIGTGKGIVTILCRRETEKTVLT